MIRPGNIVEIIDEELDTFGAEALVLAVHESIGQVYVQYHGLKHENQILRTWQVKPVVQSRNFVV